MPATLPEAAISPREHAEPIGDGARGFKMLLDDQDTEVLLQRLAHLLDALHYEQRQFADRLERAERHRQPST
jgi:hypothetical protein